MNVREVYEAMGLSRAAFGRALNVSYPTLLRWEQPGVSPVGAACEVLTGLRLTVVHVRQRFDEATSTAVLHALGRELALGLGALIFRELAALGGESALDRALRSVGK